MNAYTKLKIESVDCENPTDKVYTNRLRACRVCLSTDGKFYSFHGNSLVEAFSKVTGVQVSPMDGFPQHICVMCSALLKKSAAFQTRCGITQNFLQEICVQNPVITTELLHNTDRTSFKLPFSSTILETNEYIPNSVSEAGNVEVSARECKEKHLDKKLKDVIKKEVCVDSSEDDIGLDNVSDFDSNNTHLYNYLETDLQDCEKIETEINTEDNINFTETHSQRNNEKISKLETDVESTKSETKKVKEQSVDINNKNLQNIEVHIEVPKIKRVSLKSKTGKVQDNSVNKDLENTEADKRAPKKRRISQKTETEKVEGESADVMKKEIENTEVDIEPKKRRESQKTKTVKTKDESTEYVISKSIDNTAAHTAVPKRKQMLQRNKTNKVNPESNNVTNVELENTQVDTEVPTKKRMFNRKFEEDFVSFAKTYNVEVIFLTLEQQMAEVQARKESEDYIRARFQCQECYRGFMKETAYTKHMACHDPNGGSYMCDICKIRFSARHKLLSHLRRHRMHFICKLCNTVSKESTLAKSHYKWHEGVKYECKHCGKKFNKPSSHMNHVRENHSPLTCEECNEPVQGTRGLEKHRASQHAGVTTFKCGACDAQFHTEAALAKHRNNMVDFECDPCLSPCEHCGEGFPTAQMLSEHMFAAHDNKMFRCEECNKAYSSDRNLGVHWSYAHKGRRAPAHRAPRGASYMCELCAKSFPSETALRYHQRVHTGEKPFQCPICPKKFRLKITLKVHINTHTGERPFRCALCPETFKSYSQRYKHKLLVHTKERPYKCHLCEKTYVVSFDLKMHIRTAHMKMPLPPRNRRRNMTAKPSIDNA